MLLLRIGICDVDYANGLRCVVIGAPTGDRSPTLCITSSRSKLISTALRRGFRKRCPHCGEGPLFSGWSQFERCSICGLVFTRNPGDTWAFTILGNHDAAVAGRMDYSYYYDAAREALDWCVERLVAGDLDTVTASMAKWWCSQKQVETADECLQLHGGYGYMQEYPISRMFIDARIQKIYGGTNEIMKVLIARSL